MGGGSGGGAGGAGGIGDGMGISAAVEGMSMGNTGTSTAGAGVGGDAGGDAPLAPQPRQPGAPASGILLAPAAPTTPDPLDARRRANTSSSQGGDGQSVRKKLLGE